MLSSPLRRQQSLGFVTCGFGHCQVSGTLLASVMILPLLSSGDAPGPGRTAGTGTLRNVSSALPVESVDLRSGGRQQAEFLRKTNSLGQTLEQPGPDNFPRGSKGPRVLIHSWKCHWLLHTVDGIVDKNLSFQGAMMLN